MLSMCSTFVRWFNAHLSWVFNFEVATEKMRLLRWWRKSWLRVWLCFKSFSRRCASNNESFCDAFKLASTRFNFACCFFSVKKNSRSDWRVFFIESTINSLTNSVDHRNNRFRSRRSRRNIFVVFCCFCFFFCVSSIFFFFFSVFVERSFEHCFQ